MAYVGFIDVAVFFGVLLVGFAYVWKRGDLDWVRAMVVQAKQATPRPKVRPAVEESRDLQPVG
jgi:NADH-quinone oxidoreductase subunit A